MTLLTLFLDIVKDALQTGLRVLPFPTRPGLLRIGDPGHDSPVFLTCNFDLTVRRVRRALRGLDCYLLVASTHGHNVWCAAGGGHLTANEVVSIIKTSGISGLVAHRRLILPQLAATGVERRAVEERTGWRALFGPVRAEDIPAYLDNQYEKTSAMSEVRFNLRDRLEMAVMWAFPISVVPLVPLLVWWRWLVLPFLAAVWVNAVLTFAATPWLPTWLSGAKDARDEQIGPRWARYLIVFDPRIGPSIAILPVFLGALAAYVSWVGRWEQSSLVGLGLVGLAMTLLVSLDLTASTPIYKSGLHEDRLLTVRLLEDRCAGSGTCEQVCPRGCFRVGPTQRKIRIVGGKSCVQCGACVVQCPEDALIFVYADGKMIPPGRIRRYKPNLFGDWANVA